MKHFDLSEVPDAEIFFEAERRKARLQVAELRRAEMPEFLDQNNDLATPRITIAIARKLVNAGSTDAMKVGRRWLVRRETLVAELQRRSARKATAAGESMEQRLERRLRAVGGAS